MPSAGDIQITHADRELFPDGTSKGQLADYYRRVASVMLPHLRDRPLMLQRFPHGITHHGFYQKDVQGQVPDWIKTVAEDKKGGSVTHALINNEASLAYLVNQDCITFHCWLSLRDRPRNPDRIVFDLDPAERDVGEIRLAAKQLRELLDELRLISYVQTTGSRGFHIVVPLDRSDNFDATRGFARSVADVLAGRHPDKLTTQARKESRHGRIYLDVMRNGYSQTSVAPYSVRANPEAGVATPIRWREIDDPHMTPARYTVHSLARRLAQTTDPWDGIQEHEQSLSDARRRLDRITQ
ncbi:MAG: non-homologous end-joining DNA ligase [Mycobacterium sp.]|nr:non-homologous end-joining DNA ligase [Mycobacterium sp.]